MENPAFILLRVGLPTDPATWLIVLTDITAIKEDLVTECELSWMSHTCSFVIVAWLQKNLVDP